MKQIYSAPDFDISIYEVEDIITLSPVSVGETPFDNTGWVEID